MFLDRRIVMLLLAVAAIAAETKPERTDRYGDPLPPHAVARLGTARWWTPDLVRACAFSRDGKTLVAGCDNAVHLFDAATGRPLGQLSGDTKQVSSVVFSPDGKMLAYGSWDGILSFCSWPSGKVLRQVTAHEGGTGSLAFAGTGKFLASGGGDGLVRLWDPATGRMLRQLSRHKGGVEAVAVSPDGKTVASDGGPTVRLWDAASGRLLHEQKAQFDVGRSWVHALGFSPDGKLLAFPTNDQQIALWEVTTGKIVRRLSSKLYSRITAVVFSPDGRTVAAASSTYGLAFWEAATGKILHQLSTRNRVEGTGIPCLTFSPDGCRVAFGETNRLRLWDLGTWREVQPLERHTDPVYQVMFSRDDKTLVTAANDPTEAVREWDVATGKKLRTLWPGLLQERNAFHLSPDHKVLTLAEIEDGLLLRSRNVATGKETRRVKLNFDSRHGWRPGLFVFSPDGKIITSDLDNQTAVLLRDTTNGKVISKIAGQHDWLLFSPDSSTLAYFNKGSVIDLYDIAKGRIICQLPFSSFYTMRNLAFSFDSRLLATGSFPDPGPIVLWETTSAQKRAVLPVPRAIIYSLAFSPDGSLLAAGDSQHVIHLWSVAASEEICQLQGHRGDVASLAFSHDGKLLASGSSDTTALIWGLRKAAEAARPHLADVPRERLERLWADLAGDDAGRAHRAIWDLVAARQTIPWLKDHLKPVITADRQRITRLIADLDSDTFAVREKATRELENMGETAEPVLRKVLAGKPSLEMRRRLEPMVNKLESWPASSSAALRNWRSLEVLEHLGTPEARRLLQQLAEGAPEARLTREAKAALRRLATRLDTMP